MVIASGASINVGRSTERLGQAIGRTTRAGTLPAPLASFAR
jgi:hypothetical protein